MQWRHVAEQHFSIAPMTVQITEYSVFQKIVIICCLAHGRDNMQCNIKIFYVVSPRGETTDYKNILYSVGQRRGKIIYFNKSLSRPRERQKNIL